MKEGTLKQIEGIIQGRTQIFEFSHDGKIVGRAVVPNSEHRITTIESDCPAAFETFKKLRGL
jgi:hypothetical protein